MKSLYTAEYITWKLETSQGLNSKIELYDGFIVNVSATLKLIRDKGCTCQKCGVVGTHFKIDDNGGLNLFYLNDNGNCIIFTKDHIIPKSKGGMNHSSNYQLLCQECNNKKADKYDKCDKKFGFNVDRLFHVWINSFGGVDKKLVKKMNTAKHEIKQQYGAAINEKDLLKLCYVYKLPAPSKKIKNSSCRTVIQQ